LTTLADILLARGLVSPRDLADAKAIQRDKGGDLVATLTRLGAVSEDDLLAILCEQVGLPLLDTDAVPSADQVRDAVRAAPSDLSWFIDNEVLAWRDATGALNVAGPRLHEPDIQEIVEQWPEPAARLWLAKSLVVDPILVSLSGERARFASDGSDLSRLAELAEEAPVIDFVNSVFAEALNARASDVHFEPFEDRMLVRLRIDGVLTQRRATTRDMFDAVASRVKLLSGMNIAERRLPQDGRQRIRVAGRDVDVRVSSLPTTWGESVVVRLLGNTQSIPTLAELGATETQQLLLLDAIAQPNGLVLITGPTGSGKTTTVYRLLTQLNDGLRKIVTIEDPVEFNLPGVLQMNVRADISLDFAAGLRSTLRQDPDVIFVGEIRDTETARTAVQAALTGHLVISTVHTNSALAAVARLIDLGVEKFLLADVLRALIGQRLLRRICSACASEIQDSEADTYVAQVIGLSAPTVHTRWRHPNGCKACGGIGYSGRSGVFEAARIDSELAAAIRVGAPESDLRLIARKHGFTTLLENGVGKARTGQSTLVEALRVLGATP
jgi:general secretion pathway protein E